MWDSVIDFPIQHINDTPATVRYVFEKAGEPLIRETGDLGSINITSILTKIIHDVGRFSERYASDCLYEIDHIRTLCDNKYPLEQEIDEIFTFGIREDGCDGNHFLMQRLLSSKRPMCDYVYATPQYRRILNVRIRAGMMPYFEGADRLYPRIECELKDLTHKFIQLDKADLNPDGSLILGPYPNGNPVPIGQPYDKKKEEAV